MVLVNAMLVVKRMERHTGSTEEDSITAKLGRKSKTLALCIRFNSVFGIIGGTLTHNITAHISAELSRGDEDRVHRQWIEGERASFVHPPNQLSGAM